MPGLYKGRCEVALDEQNRFRIPGAIAEVAHLGSQGVVLGAYNHFEVWSPVQLENDLNNRPGPDDGPDDGRGDGIGLNLFGLT